MGSASPWLRQSNKIASALVPHPSAQGVTPGKHSHSGGRGLQLNLIDLTILVVLPTQCETPCGQAHAPASLFQLGLADLAVLVFPPGTSKATRSQNDPPASFLGALVPAELTTLVLTECALKLGLASIVIRVLWGRRQALDICLMLMQLAVRAGICQITGTIQPECRDFGRLSGPTKVGTKHQWRAWRGGGGFILTHDLDMRNLMERTVRTQKHLGSHTARANAALQSGCTLGLSTST
mmetsp:Transcript_69051/g.174031  ORF Transcript_69051/g.174031 Transcript_69051/m.174031 type:complete len:238 (+) Transcript_69051:382-1095(+)